MKKLSILFLLCGILTSSVAYACYAIKVTHTGENRFTAQCANTKETIACTKATTSDSWACTNSAGKWKSGSTSTEAVAKICKC